MVAELDPAFASASAAVRLELESRPTTLALVRAVLSAVTERLAIDLELLDDLKTAVSEACNNVVQHAYPDGSRGPLRLELFLLEDSILARVGDRGVGLDERTLSFDADSGVGIPVIRALATTARFSRPSAGGTEVTMAFATERDGQRLIGAPLPAVGPRPDALPDPPPPLQDGISGSVAPVALLGPVLGRLARTLAVTAHFSLDRFSDVYLVTDAIGSLMGRAATGDYARFTLRSAAQRLELTAGPLAEGSMAQIRATTPGSDHPSALLALSDELTAGAGADGSELMHVVLADPPPA